MKAARTEAGRWLRQAESDLAFAELGAREGFPAQACFTSQQAAEKALKAIISPANVSSPDIHWSSCSIQRQTPREHSLNCWTRPDSLTSTTFPHVIPTGFRAEFRRRYSLTRKPKMR